MFHSECLLVWFIVDVSCHEVQCVRRVLVEFLWIFGCCSAFWFSWAAELCCSSHYTWGERVAQRILPDKNQRPLQRSATFCREIHQVYGRQVGRSSTEEFHRSKVNGRESHFHHVSYYECIQASAFFGQRMDIFTLNVYNPLRITFPILLSK